MGGTFVADFGCGKLNQPLILISSRLSLPERKSTAMHEFVEWSQKRANPWDNAPHFEAIKKQNPRLLKSIIKKSDESRADQSHGANMKPSRSPARITVNSNRAPSAV